MRFDHMELTVPVGSLSTTRRQEIDDFYGSIFGWSGLDIEVAGHPCRLLLCGSDQFIQLLESEQPLHSPGSDHLGLLLESRQDVDDALAACERYAERDDRVSTERRPDLAYPGLTVHTFTSITSCQSPSMCTARSPRRGSRLTTTKGTLPA